MTRSKFFFRLQRDIYRGDVYIYPEYFNDIANDIEDIYSILLSDIVKYSKYGDAIIQGDFNAYTNTQPDFVMFDFEHTSIDDVLYQLDIIMSRNNLDHKHVNKSGKCLLSLCKESCILNGRTTGYQTDQPTCITYNCCSLIDYCLVSKDILNSVGYFQVLDLHPFQTIGLFVVQYLTVFAQNLALVD